MLKPEGRNRVTTTKPAVTLGIALVFAWIAPGKQAGAEGWRMVETLLGHRGTLRGEVYQLTLPREDLNVSVKGVPLEPELALTGWLAFKPLPKGCLLRGRLVLLEGEAPKTIARLEKRGIQTVPLSLRLPNANPPIQYVEIRGQGPRAHLAQVLRESLLFLGPPPTPPSLTPGPGTETMPPSLTPTPPVGVVVPSGDWSKIENLLGRGQPLGDVLVYEVPRTERIQEQGVEIPPAMGMETQFRFQKVRGMALSGNGFMGLFPSATPMRDLVAAMGEFLVDSGELERVSKSLSKNHVLITATRPALREGGSRLFFLHFWVLGDPTEIAGGLKTAINLMGGSGQY